MSIKQDKILHFLVSMGLVLWFGLWWQDVVMAYAVVLTIGVFKEWLDTKLPNNCPCIGDMFADTLGCICGFTVYCLHFLFA